MTDWLLHPPRVLEIARTVTVVTIEMFISC